ncbi:hypothetical protein HDR58_08785 [bacterium]|nr:hypothetical protein [bacterium]
MKKKFGLLLATVMVLNTMSAMAFEFKNPLKEYNLYDDTHPTVSDDNYEREKVMDEFNANSLRSSSGNRGSYSRSDEGSIGSVPSVDIPKRRNDDLRESSRKVYGDPASVPGWLEGPSYYSNPSFDSIVAKYKKSDFAGCLQECISYVRLHPTDTLGFYYLAMCYSKCSDKENAIKAYEQVISLNDNPMIVKYATNGRNCVLDSDEETCYPNVNEPELLYPYANVAGTVDLTPVDPETLIHRNLIMLQDKLSPKVVEDDKDNNNNGDNDKKPKINLPFGTQDDKLDQFINAPYGNGLSPDLNKEYKQLQLKKIQQTINTNGTEDPDKNINNLKNIKNFDDQKSELDTNKLAYAAPAEMADLSKDPEYVRSSRELEEMRMLLGSNNDKRSNGDFEDLVPYLTEKGQKLSPEVVQSIMMRSMMPDISL